MALLLLVASYALDWVVLVVFAVVGYVLGNITPNQRLFHLQDPNIDFPYRGDTVSLGVLIVASLVGPAVVIFVISMLTVTKSTVPKGTPRSYIWRRKLWEWHAGWLGLALSFVIAWFFTSGMKNLFGKPRPNMLSRCQPDLNNVTKYLIGNISNHSAAGPLVSAAICTNPDTSFIHEGFRSFPSGHSSFSAAGLVYLSLLIAAKFGTGNPWLPHRADNDDAAVANLSSTAQHRAKNANHTIDSGQDQHMGGIDSSDLFARNQAAAAPIYLLAIAFVPFGTAIFISSSRWFDFQHHGFDILFGFLIGTASAVFAFRHYHLPLGRGAGWAWAPRDEDKAFWEGMGSSGYRRRTYSGQDGGNTLLADLRNLDFHNDPGHESIQLQEVQRTASVPR